MIKPVMADKFFQICIVVKNVERTAAHWAQILGSTVPDIKETDAYDKTAAEYHGAPTEARAKVAFFNLGPILLELIQPLGGPSTWQDFLEEKGEGVHHLGLMVEGTDEYIDSFTKNDMPLIQKANFATGRYAYMDSYKKLGVLLEFLERV